MVRSTLTLGTLLLAGAAQAGTLTPVAAYVDPAATSQSLLGINNAGYTTGNINYADNTAIGFVRAPDGTYTTFTNTAYAAGTFTTGRAISNSGTVIGYSSVPGGTTNQFRGFQRSAGGAIALLTHPLDGSFQQGITLNGIAQGINDSGTVVGNYRAASGPGQPIRNHGYILSGASFTELTDPTHPFAQINARGIANNGTVVGWNFDADNGNRGWVYSGGSYQYFRHPGDSDQTGLGTTVFEAINNVGQILGGYSAFNADFSESYSRAFMFDPVTHAFTDIFVPGANNVITWGINDSGQYVVTSDTGNFIYDPNGASAPDGSSVFAPVSGADVPPGTSQFSITVDTDTTYYIDPAFASGFEYLSGTGPLFASVTAPSGIGVGNGFSLYLWNGSDYVFQQRVFGGVAYSFASPVDRFELRGIPLAAGIGFDNPSGFVTGLTFASAGHFDGFQNALGVVPEPATWGLMLAGFGLSGSVLRRRRGVVAA